MSDQELGNEAHGEESQVSIDPVRLQMIEERLQSEQNLALGIVAGLVAALIGAAIWAAVTYYTGYQIGWMAIGVGFLVGYAVRETGKGLSSVYGVIAAGFALLGCVLGNIFTIVAGVANAEGMTLLEVMSRLDWELLKQLMIDWFSPMDLLFYGFAVFQAYGMAYRRMSEEEIKALLTEDPSLGVTPYKPI